MKTKPLATHAAHLVVLDSGDEVIATLSEFARRNAIEGASFSGIGALQQATIAYWNRNTKEYERIEVGEQVEVLAINGNIARSGDDVKIHAHVSLGRRYGFTIGGHLLRAEVYPTLEVFVLDCGTRLERRQDAETGLWLITLS